MHLLVLGAFWPQFKELENAMAKVLMHLLVMGAFW